VVRRLVEPGETVAAGQTVVAIVDPARLWVDAQVDEAQSPRLAVGERATIRFDALPGRQFAGAVSFVAGATGDLAEPGVVRPPAEPALGPARVPVRLTLDAPDPAIRPGMSAYVRIEVRK
jgi:multidrug resistance efflux pump